MSERRHSFHFPLRVRWAEVDAQGIVFNGNYLTYFDVGITEYWRAVGLPYPAGIEDTGADLFTVKTLVNYHGPAHYDDELLIGVTATRLGTSSMTFELGISRGDRLLISGEVVYVTADPKERRSVPIPARLRAAVEAFQARAAGTPAAPGQDTR